MSGLKITLLVRVPEPDMAPDCLDRRQPESVILIFSGQRNIADLTLLQDVKGQGFKCVADAESHC